MKDLFGHDEPVIPGLSYVPDYIAPPTERELLAQIDRHDWILDLKRRVQHYGYRYDYKSREVAAQAFLGELPAWLSFWGHNLCDESHCSKMPDQVIVNEYMPGQGIASHIDRVHCFGDPIITLSLGSSCLMEFTHDRTGEKIDKVLEACSLAVMSGPSRYDWQHGIRPRKTDIIHGEKTARTRRVSITFRNVILASQKG